MQARIVASLVIVSLIGSQTVDAENVLGPGRLEPDTQATGWWLAGSGTVSILAGAFSFAIAGDSSSSSIPDVQRGGGIAMAGLGAGLLVFSMWLLSRSDPGACEISGTAFSPPLGPSSRPAVEVMPLGPSSRPATVTSSEAFDKVESSVP